MVELEGVARSLSQALAEGARDHPDVRVVVSSETRPADLTLAEIVERGQRFGAHLQQLGIDPGDVVALQLPAWVEWQIAAVGVFLAGAVLLPIVSIYGAKEIGFILRQSRTKMIVTPRRWRKVDYVAMIAECGPLAALEHHIVIGDDAPAGTVAWEALQASIAPIPLVPRGPDDLAMLVYTSGTTADPKGVQHTSRTLLSELAANALARQGLPPDVALSPWPPGHIAGAGTMLRTIIMGTDLVTMDQWDPAVAAALVERHRATSGSFTPFHLSGLLDAAEEAGRDISSLTRVMVGGTTVPPALVARCEARGLPIFRSYGSSEMPTVTMGDPKDPLDKRLTTEGRPMPGAQIRFVDDEGRDVEEGELVIKGFELFTGYLDARLDRDAFLPGGWFRTGDVGCFDADGFLRITDRKKDIIIRGGENISSREIEDLLLRHPDVREASVVAAPDRRMGEVVCAFVVVHLGAELSVEAVREFFSRAGVARQKSPERLVLVEGLPRNSTGKVLKHELRARALVEFAGDAGA